jgi:hypothetical protein
MRNNLIIGVVAIAGVLFIASYLGFFSVNPNPSPGPTPILLPGKSIAVTGSYVGPQGTVYGAIGNAVAYGSNGQPLFTAALTAASAFSLTVASGATYKIGLDPTLGNDVVYWMNFNDVSIPKYGEDLFTTTYALPNSFPVWAKTVTWTESAALTNGVVSGTASTVYTANAWGGTQTYTAGTVNLYTAFGAGTQVAITVSIAVGTTYSQWGFEGSLPNFMQYSISPLFVFWTNKTDWTLASPGTAQATRVSVNGTAYVFIGKLPVINCYGTAGTQLSANFVLNVPSAGQGQYGMNIIMNSSIPWIVERADYKTNAPTGYGAVFYGARFVIGHLG